MDENTEKKSGTNLAPILSAITAFLCSLLASYLFSTVWIIAGIIPLMIAVSEYSKLIITRQYALSIIVGPVAIICMAVIQIFAKAGAYPVVMAGSFIVAAAFLAVAAEHNFGRLTTNIVIAVIYGAFFLIAGLIVYTGLGYELTIESFKEFFSNISNQVQTTIKDVATNFIKNSIYATSIDADQYGQELAESLIFSIKATFAVVFVAILEFMGHCTTGIYIFTAKRTGYEIIVPLGGWMIDMSHISAIVYFIAEASFAVFYMLEIFGVAVDVPYIVMMNFVIILMPNMIFVAFQRMFRKRPEQTRQRRFPFIFFFVLLFFAPFFLLLSLATVGAMQIYGEYRAKKLEELKNNDDDHFDDFNNDDNNGNDDFQ
ncbi:MAG: hypothetical protein K6F14_03460 [Clostridiales bacterium]|nr:hypothetical protein [Clostridiales bacterium]